MTISPARRVHPQTLNAAVGGAAFDIVAEAKASDRNIDYADAWDFQSDQHFLNVLQALFQLERENPHLAPELRMLRDEQRRGIAKDAKDGQYARVANRKRIRKIAGYGQDQIEILEPMLGARPTRRALGSCAGVDGWDGGA